jgi:hypothetical protein
VALSFVVAGLTCAFAGLCYAEFASIIPIAGSAYTYGYATLGELVAWIIGWDLTLEYAFGASTVASGWAGYFNSLMQQLGFVFPPALTTTTGNTLVKYQGYWIDRMSLPPGGAHCFGGHYDPGGGYKGVGKFQLGDCDCEGWDCLRVPGGGRPVPVSPSAGGARQLAPICSAA